MDDIVPDLLEKIQKDFFAAAENNPELKRLLLLLTNGKANFIDAHEFAVSLGRLISEALQQNISSAVLPDGKMYYNIAERILNDVLGTNHRMVSSYAMRVQETLNKEAGIGLKSIQAPINQARIDSLINRIAYENTFDDVSWILAEPVVNFSKNVVDKHIQINADFHYNAGLQPKIIRSTDGNCCEWCDRIAGVYHYPGVSRDVFRRHDRCTCTIDYHPGDGKKQNAWSKKWSNEVNTRAAFNKQRESDVADNLASEDRREYQAIVKKLGRAAMNNISLQDFVNQKNQKSAAYLELKDKVAAKKAGK